MPKRYRVLMLAGLASIAAGLPAWALEEADSHTLQQIVVVGTTPVPVFPPTPIPTLPACRAAFLAA